jgi:hypothetical protein
LSNTLATTPEPPRLSIWHILIWCFVSAILLISIRREALLDYPAGYVMFAACNGGTITVSILLLTWVSQCIRPEPGYWLAIASLLDGFMLFRSEIAFLGGFGFGEVPKMLFLSAFVGCTIVQAGWHWSWRLSVFLIGVRLITSNFPITFSEFIPFSFFEGQGWSNPLFRSFCTSIEWLGVCVTLIAIGIDVFRRHHRNWLHWVGILYCIMLWVNLIQSDVFPILFPEPPEVRNFTPSDDPFGAEPL